MTKSSPVPSLRRSARIPVRIPVTVSGTLADGNSFTEETYVLSVSKFGARLKSQHRLEPGTEIRVKPRIRAEGAPFQVVWIGQEGTLRAGEIGIQYVEVSNLLGVTFPD